MKEATGELNMTVITVVAIAAIATLFYLFVWPTVEKNIATGTCKSNWQTTDTCSADQLVASKETGSWVCSCP